MPEANYKLLLDCFPVGEDWQPLLAPQDFNQIELTGNKNWAWCTNLERVEAGAAREVLAGVVHPLVTGRPFGAVPWFRKGDLICYVRALQPEATLWLKCTF